MSHKTSSQDSDVMVSEGLARAVRAQKFVRIPRDILFEIHGKF